MKKESDYIKNRFYFPMVEIKPKSSGVQGQNSTDYTGHTKKDQLPEKVNLCLVG